MATIQPLQRLAEYAGERLGCKVSITRPTAGVWAISVGHSPTACFGSKALLAAYIDGMLVAIDHARANQDS